MHLQKGIHTMRKNYSIFDKEKIVAAILLAVILIGFGIGSYCFGEEPLATCYAMCKPGSRVSVRMEPSKDSLETGFLECGDSFKTDGESIDGWIRCYGVGENGWIYSGYVVTEPVRMVGQRYVCSANKQVACRKWMAGPQIDERPWMKSGQHCQVFCESDGWAVTSRGYVKTEWLDCDPE